MYDISGKKDSASSKGIVAESNVELPTEQQVEIVYDDKAMLPDTEELLKRRRKAKARAQLQLKASNITDKPSDADYFDAAQAGVSGQGHALPYLNRLQPAFGKYNLNQIQAYTNPEARKASQSIGAQAYATGNKIAFNTTTPSLHTVAHEAAHIIQQRSGVSLKGGIGEVNDPYERHADEVADAVVKGKSVEALLGRFDKGNHGIQQDALQLSALKNVKSDDINTPRQDIKDGLQPYDVKLNLSPVDKDKIPRAGVVEATIDENTLRKQDREGSGKLQEITNMAKDEAKIIAGIHASGIYDAGHLIADSLIDGAESSWEYWNLAPQTKHLNEQTYSNLMEKVIADVANRRGAVKMETTVMYPNNGKYQVTIATLLKHKVLVGNKIDDQQADILLEDNTSVTLPLNKTIDMYRRIPEKWQLKAESILHTKKLITAPITNTPTFTMGSDFQVEDASVVTYSNVTSSKGDSQNKFNINITAQSKKRSVTLPDAAVDKTNSAVYAKNVPISVLMDKNDKIIYICPHKPNPQDVLDAYALTQTTITPAPNYDLVQGTISSVTQNDTVISKIKDSSNKEYAVKTSTQISEALQKIPASSKRGTAVSALLENNQMVYLTMPLATQQDIMDEYISPVSFPFRLIDSDLTQASVRGYSATLTEKLPVYSYLLDASIKTPYSYLLKASISEVGNNGKEVTKIKDDLGNELPLNSSVKISTSCLNNTNEYEVGTPVSALLKEGEIIYLTLQASADWQIKSEYQILMGKSIESFEDIKIKDHANNKEFALTKATRLADDYLMQPELYKAGKPVSALLESDKIVYLTLRKTTSQEIMEGYQKSLPNYVFSGQLSEHTALVGAHAHFSIAGNDSPGHALVMPDTSGGKLLLPTQAYREFYSHQWFPSSDGINRYDLLSHIQNIFPILQKENDVIDILGGISATFTPALENIIEGLVRLFVRGQSVNVGAEHLNHYLVEIIAHIRMLKRDDNSSAVQSRLKMISDLIKQFTNEISLMKSKQKLKEEELAVLSQRNIYFLGRINTVMGAFMTNSQVLAYSSSWYSAITHEINQLIVGATLATSVDEKLAYHQKAYQLIQRYFDKIDSLRSVFNPEPAFTPYSTSAVVPRTGGYMSGASSTNWMQPYVGPGLGITPPMSTNTHMVLPNSTVSMGQLALPEPMSTQNTSSPMSLVPYGPQPSPNLTIIVTDKKRKERQEQEAEAESQAVPKPTKKLKPLQKTAAGKFSKAAMAYKQSQDAEYLEEFLNNNTSMEKVAEIKELFNTYVNDNNDVTFKNAARRAITLIEGSILESLYGEDWIKTIKASMT